MSKKIIFIDRDGTLIDEPEDKQIDSLEKFKLKPHTISALLTLKKAGYQLVMVSNQDGLGTGSFPQETFEPPQKMLIDILQSEGIVFDNILICPHKPSDQCECRKPKLGLMMSYLRPGMMDVEQSYVIGDRQTDVQLAENMGICGILYENDKGWPSIVDNIINKPRRAQVERKTKETNVKVLIDLDQNDLIQIDTGIGFFDHMLEQLAKHGGFSAQIKVSGDLHIDEHHTVEDTGLALGQALRQALSDKYGIARYGFLLPMDEALAQVAIDLSGRAYFMFSGDFKREMVGGLATELVPHFFRSLAETLGAAIHIQVTGDNAHHMIESIFKGVGRALRQAMVKQGNELPTTKGVL